jgi:hypothetical protein
VLARGATGSPTPTVPVSDPTQPKDAGVALPSSTEPVGRVAEEQVQQSNVEPDSLQQGIRGWSSQAFLIVVMATAALLGLVIHLFMRRRRTVSASATPSSIPKNLEGGEEKAPLEITIGKTGETGQGAAIPMSQNSAYSSKIESTNEEVLPDTVLIEPSELSTTDSSAVENVTQLAKRYAMGTPSEKEFQRLKGLISHS